MTTHRILRLLLTCLMLLGLAAYGSSPAVAESSAAEAPAPAAETETAEAAPETENAANPAALPFPKSVIKGTEEDIDPSDDNSGVVNEAYAAYYKEGSALEGVKAIIASGNCFINGMPVPASEDELDELYPDGYTVNDTPWLVRSNDGWSLGSGFFAKTMDGPYLDAAAEMLRSKVNNGLESVLYDDDGDGYADRIETMVYLSAGATEIIENDDGTITIDLGSYVDTIDYPAKYDVLMGKMVEAGFNTDPLRNIEPEYFDETIQPGDATVYYKGADGHWHILRATEVHGVFNDGADHQSYVMDGVYYQDLMNGITVSYSAANRSGGYSSFMKFFGFNDDPDYEVSMWLIPMSEYATANTKPLGFTSNENAAVFLQLAIDRAQEELDTTVISEDGRDVAAGMKWISADLYNELSDAVQMAKDTLAVEERPIFLDYQTYLLYLTLDGTGGDISAKFTGYDFMGFENYASEYYPLTVIENEKDLHISDSRFDPYFEGSSAAEGLRAVVNAGEVYVNHYQLSAEPAEYEVNGTKAVYETSDGWAWNTHELYAGTSPDYEDAAYNFADNLSGLAGQSVRLLAKTGTDTVARIETMVMETGLASELGGNYALVYYADADGNTFTDGNGDEISFDSGNGSSSVTHQGSDAVNEGDIVVFWKDATTTGATSRWTAIRPTFVRGTLSGTAEEPMWTEEGSDEAVPVIEAITGMRNLPDDNRLSAFLGKDGTVTMWMLPTDDEITAVMATLGLSGKTIGFTEDAPLTGDSSSGEPSSNEMASAEMASDEASSEP